MLQNYLAVFSVTYPWNVYIIFSILLLIYCYYQYCFDSFYFYLMFVLASPVVFYYVLKLVFIFLSSKCVYNMLITVICFEYISRVVLLDPALIELKYLTIVV